MPLKLLGMNRFNKQRQTRKEDNPAVPKPPKHSVHLGHILRKTVPELMDAHWVLQHIVGVQTPHPLQYTTQVQYMALSRKFEGSQPEWCISSMIYSRDTPFWSGTLKIHSFSVNSLLPDVTSENFQLQNFFFSKDYTENG